jgi:hypothetical protein
MRAYCFNELKLSPQYSARVRQRAINESVRVGECWEFRVNISRQGYPRLAVVRPDKKNPSTALNAHRVVYAAFKGTIPPRMTIDHTCNNRLCVNPEHLEMVTVKENILRKWRRGSGTFRLSPRELEYHREYNKKYRLKQKAA